MSVSVTFALLFCLGGVISDLNREIVDNLWIVLGWAAGLCCRAAGGGARGAGAFLAGAALPIAALWIFFSFGALGAGDIKLLSVVGGFLGYRAAFAVALWSVFCGGALALAILCMERSLRQRFRNFFQYIKRCVITRRREPYKEGVTARTELHYTVPILMGAMLVTGGLAI